MNKFKATRVTSGKSREQQLYDTACSDLVDELETPLFEESQGFWWNLWETNIAQSLKMPQATDPIRLKKTFLSIMAHVYAF